MIDKDKTLEKFGYDIDELKPNSCKLVIWICASCKITKEKTFRLAKKNKICLTCSNKINSSTNIQIRSKKMKEWFKNNEHPLKGTNRPENVIEAIRLANTGKKHKEESKIKMSQSRKGDKNHFYGKKHSADSINKMSETHKKIVKRGKDSHFYGKIYHPKKIKYDINGNIFYFKSSWEYKVALYFIENQIKWEYESKKFEITIDDHPTTYTPDFYLPDTNTIIEVKGYWREDAIKKFIQFKNIYEGIFNLEVWNKELLKQKHIL